MNSFQRSVLIILVVQYLAARFFFCFWFQAQGSDIVVYHSYASDYTKAKSRPHLIDLSSKDIMEYPPLAVAWMWAPSLLSKTDSNGDSTFNSWRFIFKLRYLLFDLLLLGLLIYQLVKPTLFLQPDIVGIFIFVITGIFLSNFLYERMDFWLGGMIFISVLLLFSRFHWAFSFFVLAAGINFKLIPLLLVPVFIAGSLSFNIRGRMQILKDVAKRVFALALFTFLIFLPFLILKGWKTLDFLTYHSARGLQLETLYSSCLMMLNYCGMPVHVTYGYGAFNLLSPHTQFFVAVSTFVVLLSTLVLFLLFVKGLMKKRNTIKPMAIDPKLNYAKAMPQQFIQVIMVTLLFSMLFSKVFSPQYILWIVPIFALLSFKHIYNKIAAALFIIACALTTPIFPYMYFTEFIHNSINLPYYVYLWEAPTLKATVLLFTRNLFLLSTAIVITFALIKDSNKKTAL